MNILLLKGFNNYTNRIVVKYTALDDYKNRSKSYIAFTGINFNSNDGITTELVIGNEAQQISTTTTVNGQSVTVNTPLDWEKSGNPDYLICFEGTDTIVSRWFVIESKRTRLGQYQLLLKRDTIAEHITEVSNATCFIEKGLITDKSDPAIYNKEEITTNQIKKDEFLLRDETQCPWIVGYVAKDRESSGTLTPTVFTEQTIPGPEADDSACQEIYANETAFWNAHQDLIGDMAILNSFTTSVEVDVFYAKLFSSYNVGQTVYVIHTPETTTWKCEESDFKNNTFLHSEGGFLWKTWLADFRGTVAPSFVEGWLSDSYYYNILAQIAAKENINFIDYSRYQTLMNYIKGNPTIKIGTKYYKPVSKYGDGGLSPLVTNASNITLGSSCYDIMLSGINRQPVGVDGAHDNIIGNPGPETFKIEYSFNRCGLGLREIFSECKAKIPASVPVLKDAPYHMFAIPYADNLALFNNGNPYCNTNKSVAMSAAQALAQNAGAGVVYDVQLLPYCPIRDIIKTTKVTGHPSIEPATFDVYMGKLLSGKIIEYSVVKINHEYVISKEIDSTERAVGIRSHIITGPQNTASPLKIKIGTNLENPTQYYDAYEVLVVRSDLQDITSPLIIKIYKTIQSVQQNTPEVILDYATYVAGDEFISLEATDSCEYTYLIQMAGGGNWLLGYTYIPSGGAQGSIVPGMPSWKSLVKDYVFYEDYYKTTLDIANVTTSNIVPVVGGVESSPVNVIFWCTNSQFTFNKFMDNYFLKQIDGSYKQDAITKTINEKVKFGTDIKDIKVRNQVEMMRLASPNYSNFFDINVQRNKGIEFINIDCTYKPYQPYMHLNPNFKGLYGADFDDVRGLICGGDYSIATTSDAWATYQLQNKNFQAIFDRQIQQIETTQEIQAQSDIINAFAGVGVGAVGGALAGSKAGPYGAIAGAVVGAGMSAVGGVADVYNNQRLRELQLSTMKDIHGYQLENIKALPFGLSKTSYLTNNNKIFPFLEFYSCTETEEMAVRNLLDYNSMTINRVGKIRDFQTINVLPYIKAQLIRIDLTDDAHHVKDIAEELKMGIYFPKQ